MSSPLPETHLALYRTTTGQPLELKHLPTPQPVPGSVIIKILYVPVVSYTKEVQNGTRQYPYPKPFVPGPGGIGRVAALGPDATSLSLEDLVYVDSVVRSRDEPSDMYLLGAVQGGTAGSAKLARDMWRNGTYAEYCSVPLENAYRLDEALLGGELGYKFTDLTLLARYLVPYGGLRDINVCVGETIVVAPATGAFGGAAVAVALAMGANVIAMGRNEATLHSLVEHFGARVKAVTITNDVGADTQALKKAASGPIDAVLEISPPAAAQSLHIKSAILALKKGGRVSIMGGIREDYGIPMNAVMRNDLSLKGKWMYEREDVKSLIRMVETGRLAIGERNGVKIEGDFAFAEWEKAFDVASENARWDAQVIMKPGV